MPVTSLIDNVNYPRYMNPHTQRHAYAFGGALYAILRDDVVNFNIRMYRSLDGGLTSVELDAANSPLFGSSAGFVFSGSTCHVFFKALGTNILSYIPFDLLTNTWGAVVPSLVNMGIGGFPIYAGVRSTGEIIVFYRRAGLPLATECWYMAFNAGIFGAEVQVSGTPGEPVGTTKSANGLLVDASDVVHFFYAPVVFFGNYTQYHRGMSAANVLDVRQNLYLVPSATTNGPITGVPTVDSAGVLSLPFNRYIGAGPIWHTSILYGTTAAMTSPVWTDATIDATEPAANTGFVGGNTVTFAHLNAAGDLMVWWNTVYIPYGTNKLLYSTRVAGVWSAPVPYYRLGVDANPDPAVANQFLHDISVVNLGVGGFGVLISAEFGLNPATGLPYCSSAWVLAVITTLTINKVQVPPADPGRWNLQIDGVTVGTGANVGNGGTTGAIGVVPGLRQAGETPMPGTNPADYITTFGGDLAADGSIVMALGDVRVGIITNTRRPVVTTLSQGGFRRMVVLIPNEFDHALKRELALHLANRPQKACNVPILWRDINWVRAPADYIPFRKVAAIPTPLAASGDVEVLNFEVPQGYDGLIAGLFNVYTGPGFREGNGDIEWRLIINRTYAIHLGRVMVTLGSRQQCYPVDGGIFIQSGTHIRYIVNVPNLSGGILPLATQIVCGLEGLFYART